MLSMRNKILFFILFFASVVFSQGLSDAIRVAQPGLGVGARALGMGNAFSSTSDDASAMYYNPAGLGLIRKLEFMGGIEYYKYNNDATFLGNTSKYSNNNTKLNQVAFAFPFPTVQGSLVFGLAYNSANNLTGALSFDGFNSGNTSMIQANEYTDYDFKDYSIPYWLYLSDDNGFVNNINGNLNQSGTILESGSINNWTLSGAVEVYPKLFLGASLNVISGEYNYSRDYYEDDTRGVYANTEIVTNDPATKNFKTFNLNSIIKWDIGGWDLKLGMLYQLKKYGRFGLTIQFPKTFSINEEFIVDAYSVFNTSLGTVYLPDDIKDNLSDKVEYDITTPFEISASGAVNYLGIIVSGEASLIDYSQIEFTNIKGISEKSISRMNKDIKDNLRTVFNLNFGAEYTIPDAGIRLRAGYIIQPSPYKDDPSDFDRKYITGGIGLLIDQAASIDIAYAHGLWKNLGDNYGYKVSRTQQSLTADKLLLSFAYRF